MAQIMEMLYAHQHWQKLLSVVALLELAACTSAPEFISAGGDWKGRGGQMDQVASERPGFLGLGYIGP